MHKNTFLIAAMIALVPGLGFAKVDGSVQEEFHSRLEGKSVLAKVDVKQIKVVKQVRGDRMGGIGGAENMEQTKDATIVGPRGVRYADEAHARAWLYAARGTQLRIDAVDFGKSSIEIEVTANGSRESTVITFEFDEKLDPSFTARPAFEAMLAATFDGRL